MAFTNEEVDTAIDQEYNGVETTSHDSWDDLPAQLVGRRLGQTAGTVDYNYDEVAVEFSPSGSIANNNDVVGWSLQKPHAVKDTSSFHLHIHWEQDFDGVLSPTWEVQYRIQNNGGMKTDTWTSATVVSSTSNEAFDRPTGTGEVVNQITRLVSIDMSSSSLSSTVQFRLTRSDATAGTVLATFVDCHVNRDQRGSRQEYVK